MNRVHGCYFKQLTSHLSVSLKDWSHTQQRTSVSSSSPSSRSSSTISLCWEAATRNLWWAHQVPKEGTGRNSQEAAGRRGTVLSSTSWLYLQAGQVWTLVQSSRKPKKTCRKLVCKFTTIKFVSQVNSWTVLLKRSHTMFLPLPNTSHSNTFGCLVLFKIVIYMFFGRDRHEVCFFCTPNAAAVFLLVFEINCEFWWRSVITVSLIINSQRNLFYISFCSNAQWRVI